MKKAFKIITIVVTILTIPVLIIEDLPKVIENINKNTDMAILILKIFVSIAFPSILIGYYINLRNRLKRFNRGVLNFLISQAEFNKEVFIEFPQLKEKYLNKLDAVNNLRPLTKDELTDIYIFDEDNPLNKKTNK